MVKKEPMQMDYGSDGKPVDKSYLEVNLPGYLQHDIDALVEGENDPDCLHVDCLEDEVYGSINLVLYGHEINDEQARYLRKKYLGME